MITEHFDKTYCINMDKRPDRWEKVSKTFSDLGIEDVHRYSGVDGSTLDLENMNYKKSLLAGELGILETHLNLIKEAKEEGLEKILIMEDDVCFTDEISKFDEYLSAVPEDWDLLFVGGNHVYGQPPVKVNDKVLKLNHTVAIHCLAVKNTVFDTIIAMAKRRQKQIDAYYADIQKGYNAYAFTPNMALQYEDFSDIQNRRVNYDNFLKH